MIGAAASRFDPEVEAALLARYGVDSLSREVTPRRIVVLLRHLPGGYLSGAASWSVEDHLLATVADALHSLLWVTVTVNSAKGRKPPKIKPIPRPGDAAAVKAEKPATLRELATLLSKEGLVT